MNKESLDKASIAMIKTLRDLEIDNVDKMELMLNINKFLDDKKYDENVKILRIHDKSAS